MVKRIVGYQIETSICIKCCLRQVFNDFINASQEYLDLVSQHQYEETLENILSK